MKRLQLTPPLLVITMGLPGSGKTFFSRQFADLYNIARVSEDRIRFELFAKPTFSYDEHEIIQSIFLYMTEELMETGQTIVCDGSFVKQQDRKRITDLAQKKGYRTLFVWLQTDLETSSKRASRRDRRNPDSKYSFPLTADTFNEIRNSLEKPGEKEAVVVVSGKHAIKSQCLTVLRKITVTYSDSITKDGLGPTPQSAIKVRRPNRDTKLFIQ